MAKEIMNVEREINEVFGSQYRLLELVETMAAFLHDREMFEEYEEEYGDSLARSEREYLFPADYED